MLIKLSVKPIILWMFCRSLLSNSIVTRTIVTRSIGTNGISSQLISSSQLIGTSPTSQTPILRRLSFIKKMKKSDCTTGTATAGAIAGATAGGTAGAATSTSTAAAATTTATATASGGVVDRSLTAPLVSAIPQPLPVVPNSILGKQLIILAGATSVGKSAVASQLCKILDAEIVLADSVQIYKHLDIGSNKPSKQDQLDVPHHMVDLRDPDEGYTCGDFVRTAAPIIFDILERGKTPVIVGGSTMWIQWLIHGMPDAPKPAEEVVLAVIDILKPYQEQSDWEGAVALVRKYDRVRVDKLSKNDWYRLHRYFEIVYPSASEIDKNNENRENLKGNNEISAESSSSSEVKAGNIPGNIPRDVLGNVPESGSLKREREEDEEADAGFLTGERSLLLSGLDVRCFFLSEERHELYHCIDSRCEDMLTAGLLQESTQLLLNEVLTPESPVAKSIGYRQSIDYLCREGPRDGDAQAFEQFIRDFATATRNYAKRQLQWYRKDEKFLWVKIDRKGVGHKDPAPYQKVTREIMHWCGKSEGQYDAALKIQIQKGHVVTATKSMKTSNFNRKHRHAMIIESGIPKESKVLVPFPITPEMRVGDIVFHPSSASPAGSSAGASSDPSTVAPTLASWTVVQIVNSDVDLFPRTLPGKSVDMPDIFTEAEMLALTEIKESKTGAFNRAACGLPSAQWTAEDFEIRAAEGTKKSIILKSYQNTLNTKDPRFRSLLSQADSCTKTIREKKPVLAQEFLNIAIAEKKKKTKNTVVEEEVN